MAALATGSTVLAIIAGLALDGAGVPAEAGAAGVAASTTATSTTPTPVPSDTIAMAPAEAAPPIVRSAVVAPDGTPAGPVTGGTVVSVSGTDLAGVTSASFGDLPAQVVSATADTVTLQVPESSTTGEVPVSLYAESGEAVQVALGTTADGTSVSAAASAALTEAIEPTAGAAITAPAVAPAPAATPSLTFTYVPDPAITAQIDYVLAHWQEYNTDAYGAIPGNDCVNFTSQSLIARGWAMDADWSYSAGKYSTAWASSTAFAAYLTAHPERATPLTAAQRTDVKVGDIVQFDWDNSGDKDHTGIVTRVESTATGVEIYYAGHTNNTDYRSVDESLALSGGSVSYWSVA